MRILGLEEDQYFLEKTANNDYYIRNKARLAQASREYRLAHKHEISRRAKKYRRSVKMGMHRPKQRVRQGNSYTFIRR